jgi:phage N-6-adenine-methyltransferase
MITDAGGVVVQGIVTPYNSNTPEEERDLYQTPDDIFEEISKVYGPFLVDAAANESNHKCEIWFGPGSPFLTNALTGTWCPVPGEVKVFCNPPWSRGNIYAFMRKATIEHAERRALTTFLLPATTDVKWFHDFVWDSRRSQFHPWLRVFFMTPRVRYVRPNGTVAESPGIGSMIVSFRSWADNWNLGSVDTQAELTLLHKRILERAK